MNYGELKTFILADAHRTDLSEDGDNGAEGFIRRAEGHIRRLLTAYELSATIDEDDRVSAGVYTLPSYFLHVRTIVGTYASKEYNLDDVGLSNIKRLPSTATPQDFAIRGNTVEIRGVPATDAAFTVNYFGHPAPFSDDADENDLLTDHEAIYVSASKFELFTYAQDRELAGDEFARFERMIGDLNEQIARKLGGGGNTVGPYNLGNFCVSRGF